MIFDFFFKKTSTENLWSMHMLVFQLTFFVCFLETSLLEVFSYKHVSFASDRIVS